MLFKCWHIVSFRRRREVLITPTFVRCWVRKGWRATSTSIAYQASLRGVFPRTRLRPHASWWQVSFLLEWIFDNLISLFHLKWKTLRLWRGKTWSSSVENTYKSSELTFIVVCTFPFKRDTFLSPHAAILLVHGPHRESRPLASNEFLSMRRVFASYCQPIRFVRFVVKSVNRGLLVRSKSQFSSLTSLLHCRNLCLLGVATERA